jgi:CRISPR-associated protein Csh2
MKEFKNRVFGCVGVKAINSNYNADFSGQPRTLPSGTVYATDKAFKYAVKNYLKDVYVEEKIFYFKSLNNNLNPISLNETYKKLFGEYPTGKDNKIVKSLVAKNLLECLDIRLFGATFAGATNISLHGPVQINHGVNFWKSGNIYTEQITSPFSNKADDSDAERGMTTIGRQSKLDEGHYLHHFSINPLNLRDIIEVSGQDAKNISIDDILKLKEAFRRCVTWYDSTSKAGCENEFLVWIQLKDHSKAVLPNLTTLIELSQEKVNNKCVYDFAKLSEELIRISSEIELVEVYYNKQTVLMRNLPENIVENDL